MTEAAPRRPAIAGAFGGGGLFGIGYAMGILDGLRSRGIDLHDSPMIGTSAGSWAAAATALGIPFDRLAALKTPRFPDPRSGVLERSARLVFGRATHPMVSVVACQLPRLRRTVLACDSVPLSVAVAASSAVPGLLSPQRVNGRLYIDGGVRSGVSVDLAPASDTLIVIAPLAGAMFGPFNNIVERNTAEEIHDWTTRHGGRVLLFAPGAVTAKVATLPHHLFDKDRGVAAYDLARREALDRAL